MTDAMAWSHPVRLSEFSPGKTVALAADPSARDRIAKLLDLPAVHRLDANLVLRPWLDGGELRGAWSAGVVQLCGVSLDEFDQSLQGAFTLRLVPAGSPNAPTEESEMTADPDAPDPPDVLEGDTVDLAAYVVEHLALELDPFPRKPGATFEPPSEPAEPSPFAALAQLKPPIGRI